MRIAIISDIHGNLVALEAVLADLDRFQIDQIVCLGDVAASGPQPHQIVERLQCLNCPVVMGNTDAWLLQPQPSTSTDEDTRRIEDIDRWCIEQLSPADLLYLQTFPPVLEIQLADRITLCCFHGSPRSNADIVMSTSSDQDLEQMLSPFRAPLMAGGHTHMQMLRRYKDLTIINPGSVGLPFECDSLTGQVRNPPWAEYALVGCENGNLRIELRRVPVVVDTIVQAALMSGMPHAAWWIKDWR